MNMLGELNWVGKKKEEKKGGVLRRVGRLPPFGSPAIKHLAEVVCAGFVFWMFPFDRGGRKVSQTAKTPEGAR